MEIPINKSDSPFAETSIDASWTEYVGVHYLVTLLMLSVVKQQQHVVHNRNLFVDCHNS